VNRIVRSAYVDASVTSLLRLTPRTRSLVREVPGELGPCVDADLAAAYVGHALTDAERRTVDDHVDVCAPCGG